MESEEDRKLLDSYLYDYHRSKDNKKKERLLGLLELRSTLPEPESRAMAAYRLGWLVADEGERAVGLLKTLLRDEDLRVRVKAALAAMRGTAHLKDELSGQLVPIFLEALQSNHNVSRPQIIHFLGYFVHFPNDILPVLIKGLDSEDPEERYSVSLSLERFETIAADAAEPVRKALERETTYLLRCGYVVDLRLTHAWTLFRMIGDNPCSRAVATEKSQDAEAPESVRRVAGRLLEEMNGQAPT